jgi:serine/threonine protein kinase
MGSLIIETATAQIYESFHPSQCSKLAIKCIKKSVHPPQTIEDECSLLHEISYPGVIQAIDICDLEHYRCVVMQLAIGGDLLEYVRVNGRMEETAACKVIHSVLQSLAYLHQLGIWHRDIKPENILLMDDSIVDPQAVIADLGYAKRFSHGESSTEFVGTSPYMAPELHMRRSCMFFSSNTQTINPLISGLLG